MPTDSRIVGNRRESRPSSRQAVKVEVQKMRLGRLAAIAGLGLIGTALWFGVPTMAARRGGDTQATLPAGSLPARVSVCFVPAQQCDVAIVSAVNNAKHAIRVQAYGFTSPLILAALADAKERGVDVRVILDKTNDPYPMRGERGNASPRLHGATFTSAANIPTWIDHAVAIAHNKLIIIDARIVIGGSYNFTASAERKNAENVTFIDSAEIANLYLANWESRRKVARPYVPPIVTNGYSPNGVSVSRSAGR